MRKNVCAIFISYRKEKSMRSIPVLMYHHINPNKEDMVTVTPEVFEGQMRYLHESGYKTLKIDELLSYISGGLALRQKAVVLTFDDGWLDNYIYAFPVIKKYRIYASVFLVTNRIEKASEKTPQTCYLIPSHKESKSLILKGEEHKVVLTWNLIKEMVDSGLIDFYSHTESHRECDLLSKNELFKELQESKQSIEKKLDRPCPYLSWPYGKYSGLALNIAKDVGYKAIFTTNLGVTQTGADPFAINRIVVKDNIAWFKMRMLIYTNSFFSKIYLKTKK